MNNPSNQASTAAPWTHYGPLVWHTFSEAEGGGSKMVAECYHDADAPLIASAPELLSIAEEMLLECEADRACLIEYIMARSNETDTDTDVLETAQRIESLISRARAVINKAQGVMP